MEEEKALSQETSVDSGSTTNGNCVEMQISQQAEESKNDTSLRSPYIEEAEKPCIEVVACSNTKNIQGNEISEEGRRSSEGEAATTYWQAKKPEYLNALAILLNTNAIEAVSVSSASESSMRVAIEELTGGGNIDGSQDSLSVETAKKLVKRCCAWVLEGKSGAEFDLIRLSGILKETAESCLYGELSDLCILQDKSLDFYRDIIVEVAEKKSYTIKLSKDLSSLIPLVGSATKTSEVWEVREISSLSYNAKVDDLEMERKKRRFHLNLLKALEKLIKSIDKAKGEDDAFSAYSKILSNPPKAKVQTKLTAGKKNSEAGGDSKKKPIETIASTPDKAVDPSEIEENLKRVKLDETTTINTLNESFTAPAIVATSPKRRQQGSNQKKRRSEGNSESSSKQSRKQVKETEMVSEVGTEGTAEKDENKEEKDENNIEVSQTGKIKGSGKKARTAAAAVVVAAEAATVVAAVTIPTAAVPTAKDVNQKKILSFFKKVAVVSSEQVIHSNEDSSKLESLIQQTSPFEENNSELATPAIVIDTITTVAPLVQAKKSILRRIGGSDPRPSFLQTSQKTQDVSDLKEVMRVIQEESKVQWRAMASKRLSMKPTVQTTGQLPQRKRRILVAIFDYVRQYKNVYFEGRSNVITGRNFLKRDEDQVQYDLDTEDELQEMNAENIENDNEEDDEEDSADDESGRHFIVPDGYLSDEGFESDKEDAKNMVFDQKKLNFANFNFAENPSKTGFIHQQSDKSPDVANFLLGYRVKLYCENDAQEKFPLCVSKEQQRRIAAAATATGGAEEQQQIVPVVIWTPERLKFFIKNICGSYNSKKQLLEQIAKLDGFKEVSKNRLEKKFKEVAQKDEKFEGENARRWLIHPAMLESFDFDEKDIEELKRLRQEEYRALKSAAKKEKEVGQLLSVAAKAQQTLAAPPSPPILPVGINIFSSAIPLKKNMNITPVKSLLKNQEAEELLELEAATKKQKEQKEKETIPEMLEEESMPLPVSVPATTAAVIIFVGEEEASSQGLRKNSQNVGENSNTSGKQKTVLKQKTLTFAVKKP